MILQSINNVIKYEGSQTLNLMQPPSPDIVGGLYRDYFNFIDSMDFIYGTQDPLTGRIPIFTTISDIANNKTIPDPNSTLHFLIPGQSYYIKIKTDTVLPVRLPIPIGLSDFLYKPTTLGDKEILCETKTSVELNTKSIILNNSNTHYITASIKNAKSNQKYFYEFIPVFSNWPANISPVSGHITMVAEPQQVLASGNIQATFTYAQKLFDDIVSIPYTRNKNIGSSYYNDNIFTILNFKVIDPSFNCDIYNDNISIYCKSCVDSYLCPKISLGSTGSGKTRYITANITNLQPDTEYIYEFGTDSSNCAANISPSSGIIFSDKSSQSGTIYGVFKFCDNPLTNCNLPSTNLFSDPFIAKTVFQNLSFTIRTYDETLCPIVKESILLSCDNCFKSTNFNTSINFSLPSVTEGGSVVDPFRSKTYYPYPLLDNISYDHFNSTIYRPEIEHVINNGRAVVNNGSSGLLVPCCEKSIVLQLEVTGAISGDKYLFDIYSYPPIDIVPNTGIVSFGEGSGSFSVIANPNGQKSSSLHAILTHEKSNKQASDSTIVSCVATGVYEAASVAASYAGWWVHPS
jgi:hypothetical protein